MRPDIELSWAASTMLAVLLQAFFSGCTAVTAITAPQPPSAIVTHAAFPVKFDGELKDAAWVKTQGVGLKKKVAEWNADNRAAEEQRTEAGAIKFLYDDTWFYLGCALEDSDIFNSGKADQLPLAQYGDVLEITLQPEETFGYWQILAAPNGAKSSFFFRSASMQEIVPLDSEAALPGLETRIALSGTLNNQDDSDQSWTMEIRIPRAALTLGKQDFGPGSAWKIQIRRKNIGTRQNTVETTVFPEQVLSGTAGSACFARLEFR